jgi:hypothetical protein
MLLPTVSSRNSYIAVLLETEARRRHGNAPELRRVTGWNHHLADVLLPFWEEYQRNYLYAVHRISALTEIKAGGRCDARKNSL